MNTDPNAGGAASNPVDQSALSVFDFNENPVRVLMRDDDPWFVVTDVCRVLEIADPSSAVRELDEDEKMTPPIMRSHSGQRGGARFLTLISESGLYALVFKSRKPEAKSFRKWVTSEVLPSIRKTGSYELPAQEQVEEEQEPEQLEEKPTEYPVCYIPVTQWALDRFPQEFIILLGRRVRGMALALGVPSRREPHPWFGSVYAYPENLYRLVMDDLTRDPRIEKLLRHGKRRRSR